MEIGQRKISISSINPDNFTSTETRLHVTHRLQQNSIHIAAIRETHIPHNLNYKLNGYRIITTAAKEKETKAPKKTGIHMGGVAILIHEDLEHHIVHIKTRPKNPNSNTTKRTLPHAAHNTSHLCTT